jgi:hypothetical protein
MEIKANIIIRLSAALLVLASMTPTLTSCHKKLQPTAIQIEDSIRHYPATILGDDLIMVYTIKNIGHDMLVITDIQPAVPTIEVDKKNVNMIPPGEEARLKFTFHSDKNIGLARHIIRIFGNILPAGEAQIIFDTHVVRPSNDLSDYEEYYQEHFDPEEKGKDLGGPSLGTEYTTEPNTDGRDKIYSGQDAYGPED